jgi:hypothetical protein
MRPKSSAAETLRKVLYKPSPVKPPARDEWIRSGIEELNRQQQEREAVEHADHQAQQDATPTTTMILRELGMAASSGSTAIPLNGAAVLRTALSGGDGTVNGRALDSGS